MTHIVLELDVVISWWLRPYIWCLSLVAAVTGLDPDAAKLERVVGRAVKVRARRCK